MSAARLRRRPTAIKRSSSLCYREGVRNGKVTINPARLVRQRKEGTGRLRFFSREEYEELHKVIAKRFPEHLAEFVISVHTGMRLSEQYSCAWSQVHFDRRTIELTKTKNGSARAVHLNSDAIAALESLRRPRQHPSDPVFPREGSKGRFDTRSWFLPCLEEVGISGYVWHCNRHTFLLLVGNGWSEYQGNSGSRGSQDDHDVGAVQPSVTSTQAVGGRAHRIRLQVVAFVKKTFPGCWDDLPRFRAGVKAL